MQIQLHLPNLTPHPTYNVENWYLQFHLIFNIVLGGEGEQQCILKGYSSFLFSNFSSRTHILNSLLYISVPRTFVHDCRFILEEIVPESWRIQDILELVRTGFAVNTQEDESEIKTPWLGHVSEDFESRIESENFESGHLWIRSALSCKWLSLESRCFSTCDLWVCGRTKMADLVM